MKQEVVFLGTGGSMGTPVIGCECPVCISKDPRDMRYRSSILFRMGEKQFLVDPSPDIRAAALKYDIRTLDGVLVTHAHEDHVGGLNDLRPYYIQTEKTPMSLIASRNTFDILSSRFSYLMDRFVPEILEDLSGTFLLNGEEIHYFTYSQQGVPVTGFRWRDFAYLTDIKEYGEEIFQELKGVKTLVLSALHTEGSPMHFSVEEAIAFSERVGPRELYLTHISHAISHKEMNESFPISIQCAYDGLKIYV
jgi:phosphoribosyl 1,2-cyclic phosphate phosphodiesterase